MAKFLVSPYYSQRVVFASPPSAFSLVHKFYLLSHYLTNILTPRQHGFRPSHSCATQLINVVDDLAKAVDDGHRTDVAIFDFSCTNCNVMVFVALFFAGFLLFCVIVNKEL